ncbi:MULTISPECIES: hypothetical protein [unclassified Mesorhizobium]|uniref:hypothetical protein n=1 Tax=unclassified Mesorhizobium TaxID=325217 RepID=UPI00112636B9|nr:MULTISPECIES: hypothetical protein [unclassified Mesorhizobium]TPL42666.1 hypothetical protein FJ961_08220 [Mesorhizobium sp. B2-4-5]TPL66667.1 hypothetical protein FJ949_09890 [Mesorhizobium sp. B2-4-1]
MIDHDLKVLRSIAGDPDAIDGWGAAVGASLGYLQGSGYVTRGMAPILTDKGWAYLRAEGIEIPGKLESFEGQLRRVRNASRDGWYRFHEHRDRTGYCDNPARGY